ncbi:hypothetical protein THS27_26295, partial [Thalassospira sp. MCCC 1A01428]
IEPVKRVAINYPVRNHRCKIALVVFFDDYRLKIEPVKRVTVNCLARNHHLNFQPVIFFDKTNPNGNSFNYRNIYLVI